MNIEVRFITLAGFVLLLGACTPTDITFGNSVRQTMAAQVIDPDPQYADAVPATDGTKAAEAVKRYRSDKVKQPDQIRTTNTQTGQGGSPK